MRFKVGVIGASGFIGVPYRGARCATHPSNTKSSRSARAARDLLEAAAREDGASVVTTGLA